ncbi:class I SAM-dependent methyltransferase [Massilia arenae]|uniref:Class I SAM-dependent methyltransferase n=1 Tax=Massilia arenae TaxID=2603288 RepID=A0A5C7G4U6_9BURK|nr:class I SAM-dependent methyltransferase [Massilia arenae]TXF98906.1 class I SAM-dependent methyltransferase [Massilia arenae]
MTDDTAAKAASLWDQRYGTPEFLFGTAPNDYLASQGHLLRPGMRALAVADGEGRNSVWLARQGLSVDAFDLSPVAVGKARQLASDAEVAVDFHIADCDAWSWEPASYDVVAAIFVQFADPRMRARLFANIIATLKPGGILILQGYTPRQLEYKTGGPGVLENFYTEEILRAELGSLDIVELLNYEANLAEGTQHAGRSALIGLVGRKVL